jgi:hypothetical protein
VKAQVGYGAGDNVIKGGEVFQGWIISYTPPDMPLAQGCIDLLVLLFTVSHFYYYREIGGFFQKQVQIQPLVFFIVKTFRELEQSA